MTVTAAPLKGVPAGFEDLPTLLEELEEHFEYDYNNLSGTTGLTGDETAEEIAEMEPGTDREVWELRKLADFRKRIAKLQAAMR